MTTHTDNPAATPPPATHVTSKDSLRRTVLLMGAPLVAYALARPLVSTDALGLAIAAAIPVLYSIGLAVVKHRIDLIAALSTLGFALACLISVLTGGSSLPLKLHEALVTFGIGVVVLIAVLIHRPVPLARLLRISSPTKQVDSSLGAIVGSFLVLHALVHFALAASLSTSSYLTAGRAIDWSTIGLGVLALSAYRRRPGARGEAA